MAKRARKPALVATQYEIGADGWPVDPEHPANRETAAEWKARTLAERHHRNWMRLRLAVEGGHIEAIAAAVRYCYQRREVPPAWLVDAVEMVSARARNARPGRQGRKENVAVDFARWDLIEYLRDTHGMSKKAAIAEASILSRGTPEAGSETAFGESHDKVRKSIDAGQFGRYAPFAPPD